MLQLAIFDAPGGTLLLDGSAMARSVRFSTNEHGFESLTAVLDVPLAQAFWLYDRPSLPHVVLTDGMTYAWEGRLEDVAIADPGITLTALGYWRSLSDVPYTALWSDTSVAAWRPTLPAEDATLEPARYQMDTNNRLYIAPRKGETFGSPGYYGAEYTYETPSAGARAITTVTFSYELVSDANWRAYLGSCTRAFGSYLTEWSLTGNGATQTGTATINLATPRDRLRFGLYRNAAAAQYTGETGAAYLRITGLRVKSTTAGTVTADMIAAALAAYINGINSNQLSADTALIAGPGVDLQTEVYEDVRPADILTRLAGLGDNATPPRQWEVGVWEQRRLHYRVRASAGRAWYVDAASLDLQRSLDGLTNSAYALYQDAVSFTQRTAVASNAESVARYGVTRRAALNVRTTSATQAAVHRDALVEDGRYLLPRAMIGVAEIYDAAGGRWPLWMARSGDSVTIRNLPPTLSVEVDRVRTFRIGRTEYECDSDTLRIDPEESTPSLEMMVARLAE